MSPNHPSFVRRRGPAIVGVLILITLAGTAWATRGAWLPSAQQWWNRLAGRELAVDGGDEGVPVPADGHAHDSADSLHLSPVAWRNIGLKTGPIEVGDFRKSITVPAIVVEQAGRSQIEIPAPMTGVVTRIYPLERQSLQPGQPLFELRLTHEDVVSAQSEFLTTLQALDLTLRELERLRSIGEEVIPGRRIIEQEYLRDQSEAALAALRQSLLLHGMTEEQIAEIERSRQVIRTITVSAPPFADNHAVPELAHRYHVQAIRVNRGESVMAGSLLGVLADHCLLYVEGQAYEDDAAALVAAAKEGIPLTVIPAGERPTSAQRLQLQLESVADQIDRESRALRFYLRLPNELTRESDVGNFISWRYRPGQRMEVQIPTSTTWKEKFVLPIDAVAMDGPRAFVFEQNGDHFDRVEVEYLFRDRDTVVLEKDPRLVGSTIALSGAYQMHLALKNQEGGGIDPHAGHNH